MITLQPRFNGKGMSVMGGDVSKKRVQAGPRTELQISVGFKLSAKKGAGAARKASLEQHSVWKRAAKVAKMAILLIAVLRQGLLLLVQIYFLTLILWDIYRL